MAEFRVYRTEQGQLHWYLVGDTGRKIAESGETYETMEALSRAIEAVKYDVANARIVDRSSAEPLERADVRFVEPAKG